MGSDHALDRGWTDITSTVQLERSMRSTSVTAPPSNLEDGKGPRATSSRIDQARLVDRPTGLDRQDSDVSNSSSTGELFDMDPLRRDSATTIDNEEEPISPVADGDSLLRPVIVRGSPSDEQRSQTVLGGKDRQPDGLDSVDKGVLTQGIEMVESGIENLAAKWKSFGFPGSKSNKPVEADQQQQHASGSSSRTRPPANTDSASDHITTITTSSLNAIGRNLSPNRHQQVGTLTHSNRPRIPSAEFQHHQHHPAHYHDASDLTPRAEHAPNYSPKSMAETMVSPTSRREMRTSADQEDDETNVSSSSRNGTIKRKRDSTIRKGSLMARGDRTTDKGLDDPDRKASVPGGYFPDVNELKRKAKQQRDAEKAKRKSEALARRARASALANFATSPRSGSPFTSPTATGSDSWRTNSRSEIESASESENSGTDEMETPWPSSARHGDTPLGLEHEMTKSSRANSLRERMNSMGSIEEKHLSSPRSRRDSMDRRSSSEILTDEDEVLQAGTGCTISNPLAPPPGYPLYSPQIGSDLSDRPWLRTSSYAGSSANNSPPSVARSHSSSQALPAQQSRTPYGQYFGFLPGGVHSASQGSSASSSGPESDLQRRLHNRFEVTDKGLHVDSSSPASGSSPHNGPSPSDSPRVNIDSEVQGSSPFEGKITIDTSPDRYVISVGEMAGFSLENITIAVKSINRSSSSSSSVPRAGLVHSHSSDASSIHSQSSARSSVSFHGADKHTVQRTSSPDVVHEGKVLHLIADRWEDSAHFERRITFGKDADFSNGVKAKFDGTKLVIDVVRRAHPFARPSSGRASLPPDSNGLPRPSFSSETFRIPKNVPAARHHSIAF